MSGTLRLQSLWSALLVSFGCWFGTAVCAVRMGLQFWRHFRLEILYRSGTLVTLTLHRIVLRNGDASCTTGLVRKECTKGSYLSDVAAQEECITRGDLCLMVDIHYHNTGLHQQVPSNTPYSALAAKAHKSLKSTNYGRIKSYTQPAIRGSSESMGGDRGLVAIDSS